MGLAERIDAMEPRERTLLFAFGGVVLAVIVLVLPYMVLRDVWEQRDHNQEVRDVTQTLLESREKLAKKRAERDVLRARYAKDMPQLASLVEQAAQEFGVELSETTNKADLPHGKRYLEHSTALKIRKVGLLALVKMVEKLESSGYPIAVTKLNIKPKGEPDSYDVQMTVSAFEKKDKEKDADGDDAAPGSSSPRLPAIKPKLPTMTGIGTGLRTGIGVGTSQGTGMQGTGMQGTSMGTSSAMDTGISTGGVAPRDRATPGGTR